MPPQNTIAINTPALKVSDTSTPVTVLAANTARRGFSIQNVGTTTAYVRIGGVASDTVYHYAIKGGTGNNDGLGGSISFPICKVPILESKICSQEESTISTITFSSKGWSFINLSVIVSQLS